MEKRIISAELMKFMSIFENVCKVSPRDCFIDDSTGVLTYIVPEGKLRKALGPGASNIRKLETRLKRRVKVSEYSDDVKSFIKSLLLPLRISDISEVEPGVYLIEPVDNKTRGMIIGRAAVNLRNLEKMVRRFFNIKEIRVV